MNKRQNITAKVYDKQGNLLSIGNNSYTKTHPKQARYAREAGMPEKLYLHAEVEGIIKALKNGTPYSIHVERYDSKGNPKMAQPCPICMIAIKKSGIKKVSFTVG